MDDFKIDGRKLRFLENAESYLTNTQSGLEVEPLKRQFRTAKDILRRFSNGHGVLLADDVGLGKTTIGAVVAWAVACQDMRVRIYAPNEILRRRWAEELERHVPMLKKYGACSERIKAGDVAKLNAGRIQVATHHALIKSHGNNEQRTACDLMIVDEAHRAKGDGSAFNEALRNLGDRAKRKLILTATPFSINLTELEQLLNFVGATDLDEVRHYAKLLSQLYSLGSGEDLDATSTQLVEAAKAAINKLRPYLIRHGVDDISKAERRHFGAIDTQPWDIPTAPASPEDLSLLLRVDRLLRLSPERSGERSNDPRFHIGWRFIESELDRLVARVKETTCTVTDRHIEIASKAIALRRRKPHPKIAAVSEAIRPILDGGEKVLVFCHHRATASELLIELEKSLKVSKAPRSGPPPNVWRAAWKSLFPAEDPLDEPIIEWLCSSGLRRQITGWIGEPEQSEQGLAKQLSRIKPRNSSSKVASIAEAAISLRASLLDSQSTSTRALLKAIAGGQSAFGGQVSHWPGRLDEGHRVMGAWHLDGNDNHSATLYTGKPDIVLAVFNSPFGPDLLIATDRLSEGVDLHRCCRHLIHYELDPSPVRTLQRNGRIRRVGSWAAQTGLPIRYGYPTYGGTRDEKAVGIMKQRIDAFGLLLGSVPPINSEYTNSEQVFAEMVLREVRKGLDAENRKLCVPCD